MSSPFNTCSLGTNSYLGCYKCGAFSHAVQALVPVAGKQSLDQRLFHRLTDACHNESQFHPMCLRVPKVVTDRIRQQFSGFPPNEWQDQVLGGVVLK